MRNRMIEEYSVKELAKVITDMRYNKVSEFMRETQKCLQHQADNDKELERKKLSMNICAVICQLNPVVESLDTLWDFCEPYEKAKREEGL